MKIAIIVAMTPDGLIGKDNQIPWHLPADLKRFKKITMGHPIVMGRKTFQSLPRILPGRQHIVLTRNKNYTSKRCVIANTWDEVFTLATDAKKLFIIGGADIYKHALQIAQEMYVTIVYTEIQGDIYFPRWCSEHWKEIKREFYEQDETNVFDMEFVKYKRKN